ncbi:uncharacterized protein A4U43_C04F17030 [Asparagus officinalis]|uniref:Uncharacterized protein n=1 Tax=Asparagus officinalis TaxID=4686 RepID=A0A5P1F230_ASPOF|nr:uncharacterized protein A4U43_C04F17030 [Asparagus officinalis]
MTTKESELVVLKRGECRLKRGGNAGQEERSGRHVYSGGARILILWCPIDASINEQHRLDRPLLPAVRDPIRLDAFQCANRRDRRGNRSRVHGDLLLRPLRHHQPCHLLGGEAVGGDLPASAYEEAEAEDHRDEEEDGGGGPPIWSSFDLDDGESVRMREEWGMSAASAPSLEVAAMEEEMGTSFYETGF